ncbi:MAG: C10 family peptidase, partial [Muribaculaceae bacterium]|nr:C10 family peptidase [Muribaculaceae bacterium]
MKFARILRLSAAAVFFVTSLVSGLAAPLTPQQALARLRGSQGGMRAPDVAQYQLTYTESSGSKDILYVFNVGSNGFVITSADDRLPAKIGYSDSGTFDLSNMPPQLKGWLEEYASEATYFFSHEDQYKQIDARASSRANISALLTTKWNQDAPFNNDCPIDNGGKCVTGCVATAMAQVINYHKYPTVGSGTHSYQWNGKTLTFDYGSTNFDFANMLDSYDSGATQVQNAAVAQLMYACGVSINMKYTSRESGAYDIDIPYALKTYFNYDPGVRLLKKIYYSNEDWEDLVYNELAENRPVIYSGQATNGGHEFVCDGYEDGYFHINWGWGG